MSDVLGFDARVLFPSIARVGGVPSNPGHILRALGYGPGRFGDQRSPVRFRRCRATVKSAPCTCFGQPTSQDAYSAATNDVP